MTKMSCQQKRENAFDEVSKSLLVISDALKRRQTYEIQQIPAVYKQDNCMKLDVEFKPPNLKQIAKEYNVINFMKIIFEVLDDFDETTESLSAYQLLKKQHAFNTLRIKQNYYQASLLCSKENVEKAYLHYSGNVVTILPKTCRVGGQRPPTNVANQLKHVQNVDHIIKLLDTSVKAIGEAKYNVADGKKLLGQLSGVLGALPHCYKLMAVFPNKPNKCDGVSKKFKTEKLTALSNYLKRNEFEGVSDFLLEYSKWFQARLEPSLTKLRQISNLKKIIRLRRTTKTDVNDVFLRDMLMCFDGPLTNIEVLLEDNKTPVSHSLSNVLSICSVANDWRGEVLNQVNMLNEISITIGQLLRQKIASL